MVRKDLGAQHYVYGLPYADDHPEFACQPCYIGAGSGKRKDVHLALARSGKFAKMRALYGYLEECLARGIKPQPFVFDTGLTRVQAYALEISLIAKYGRLDQQTGCLLNCSDGGAGARNASVASRLASIEKRKGKPSPLSGRKKDPALVEATASWHRGRRRAAEVGAHISAALKGKQKSDAHRAALARALTGHVRSEASKAKQSASSKGHSKSPETRAKMRAAALRREAAKRAAKA